MDMDSDAVRTLVQSVQRPVQLLDVSNNYDILPCAVLPDGYNLKPLAEYLVEPIRIKQRVTLLTAADFVAYWTRFKDETSVIFGDERTATYGAILDYHAKEGTPHCCHHTAVYACPKSKEWETWTGNSGKRMAQEAFALFIEDNYPDITHPTHAEMIQVSTSLQVKKDVSFASSTRLADGQVQLMYNEEIKGTAAVHGSQAGSLKVPDEFTISVPVFLGGAAVSLQARLRYRIAQGKLEMWYDLHRPHKALEAATAVVTQSIRAGLGTDPMFLGAAA